MTAYLVRVLARRRLRDLLPTVTVTRDPSAPRFSSERYEDGSRAVEVRVASWLVGIYTA